MYTGFYIGPTFGLGWFSDWFMVFNATFKIFQFYWWRKPKYQERKEHPPATSH